MKYKECNPQDISTRFVVAFTALRRSKAFGIKREFCNAIGMPPQNLHPIEVGERSASISNLCALVRVYNVSPTWLFTGRGDMFLSDGEC